ncbi:MAG TPA: GGDEF domain-containing protein [Acidocella sp.]|nr:MAG: hypothetical protein B7Z81_09975 [Acidocella sp. 20-61-6]HQT46193.1 GGDEF domain-containing protein [Acidocella sp.]
MINAPNSTSSLTLATGWLSVAGMLADLAFETDAMGRFTAFGPGLVFGRSASEFMGVEAASLLSGASEEDALSTTQFRSVITTICLECVAWHGKVRLALPDGTSGAFRLSLAPRIKGGAVTGTYGVLFDLDQPDLAMPTPAIHDPSLRYNTMLDPETGLWSSRTFAEEISRRFDRLDVEGLPGTLLYLSFARAPDTLHTAIAMRLAEELRDIVRPTDLLGRIDATTLALWCDGMDHLTGGERAARFCSHLPASLPERSLIMVGVAPRWAGSGDDAEAVTEHAAVALRLADLATDRQSGVDTCGAWRVWQRD